MATARRGRRWPWLVLILVLLGAGAAVAYALTNLDGGSDSPGTAAAATQALPIAAAHDFDPLGGGSEHPEDVHFAIDGDPGTAWQTEGYSNRNFGNAKSGVGLWVQLDAAHDVTTVTVTTLEDGWSAQIYVADQPGSSLDAWGPARASGDNLPAVQRFDLNARGQYVLIWCTQLPQSDKLQIGDVKVEGR